MNCVFTGFNEHYWAHWGSSWIYSLREVAKYKGQIIVVDCGLSDSTRNKINEKEALVVKNDEPGEIRLRVFNEISRYSKKNKGNFVYWDADAFFEQKIDQVFDEISDKLIICNNRNAGFLGGPFYQWVFLEDIVKFMSLTKEEKTSNSVLECLRKNFNKFLHQVSNKWNFIDLYQISEKKLEVDGAKPIVVHPTGGLKDLLEHKKFLFHERKDEGYLKFLENKQINFRKLIKNN